MGGSAPAARQHELPIQLSLPTFDGPLDLLLRLVEREQLDITAVSLLEVASQFVRILDASEMARAAALADFVAITARLMLLKSRSLLPRSPTPAEATEDGDPDGDLARAVEEYRVFRGLASSLDERPAAIGRLFSRAAPAPAPPDVEPPLRPVPLGDLVGALQRALMRFSEPDVVVALPAQIVTVEEMVGRIRTALGVCGVVGFQRLVDDCTSRVEVVVCFLSVLHLIRSCEIEVDQPEAFGEITLRAAGPAEC